MLLSINAIMQAAKESRMRLLVFSFFTGLYLSGANTP
jgi:hypothetical protein